MTKPLRTDSNANKSTYRNTLAKFRRLLSRLVTDEDFGKVYKALLSDASTPGNTPAMRLFFEYCVGKPLQEVDIEVSDQPAVTDIKAELVKRGWQPPLEE